MLYALILLAFSGYDNLESSNSYLEGVQVLECAHLQDFTRFCAIVGLRRL